MRARNLKPGFFKNEDLAECEPLARIFFEGLWCSADREGRLEYRPKRLKAEILPYDDCDILHLLSQLSQKGFVIIYPEGNPQFIEIPTFHEHQNPHYSEKSLNIPSSTQLKESSENIPGNIQDETKSKRAESLLLNPESLLLNPESRKASVPDESRVLKTDNCPQEEIIAAYHKILPELPKVKTWPEELRKILRTRWREDQGRQHVGWWENYFKMISQSEYLMGRVNGFTCDMEWIVRPKNMTKILNGRYHNNGAQGNKHSGIKAWLEEKRGENDTTGL
jgi:hypothetical protein